MPEVDAEKIILAQQGDEGAFAQLVDAHQVAVFNLCYRMLGDPYEAEDAAQEAFLRAYKGMKSYDRKRSFSTLKEPLSLIQAIARHCFILRSFTTDKTDRCNFSQLSSTYNLWIDRTS